MHSSKITPVNEIVQAAESVAATKLAIAAMLPREDVLNLSEVPVSLSEGWLEVAEADIYFRLAGNTLPHLIDSIPVEALENLFVIASEGYSPGENYLTGLRIHYAVKSEPHVSFSPVYQPVYMKWIEGEKPNDIYEVQDNTNFYELNGNIFVPLGVEEANNRMNNYWQSVEIRSEASGSFAPPVKGESAESALFPFQSILTLIYENPITTEVCFYNSVRKETAVNRAERVQHCVLLLSDTLRETEGLAVRSTPDWPFINRSKLCPPACRALDYDVDDKRG